MPPCPRLSGHARQADAGRAGRRAGRRHVPAAPSRASGRSVLDGALAARRDILGERLIASRDGPGAAAVQRLLPAALVRAGTRRCAADAFRRLLPHVRIPAEPLRRQGLRAPRRRRELDRHAARRRSPASRSSSVNGRELYGSCLARLGAPRLARGWLPILRTTYVDARGVRYAQESFAGRAPDVRSLVSFVRLTVDTRRRTSATAVVRFVAFPGQSCQARHRRARHARARRRPQPRARRAVTPTSPGCTVPGAAQSRRDPASYRRRPPRDAAVLGSRTGRGVVLHIPERRVLDAERSLLVHQRMLTWRYSVGNPVRGALVRRGARRRAGHGRVRPRRRVGCDPAIRARGSCPRGTRAGAPAQCSLAAADQFRLSGDPHVSRGQDARARRQRCAASHGQLHRRRSAGPSRPRGFSSDVRPAWSGSTGSRSRGRACLRSLAPGRASDTLASRRERRWQRRASSRRCARRFAPRNDGSRDGSLFVPARLLDGGSPFDRPDGVT